MKVKSQVALAAPIRTPFAQIGKALARIPAHHLGKMVAEKMIADYKIPREKIDLVIVGEGFAAAPNSARVLANLLGLRDEIPALTVSNNCVSGLDAIAEATRRIELGEAKFALVIGEESQSSMPFVITGARADKKTATLDKIRALLPDNLPEGVELRDMLEDGLGDGETSYSMQATAELLAQNYELPRATMDKIAYQSFKRAWDASAAGKYKKYMVPVKDEDGNDLDWDEAVVLRKGLVENPDRMGRAMLLFENPQIKFEDFKKKYGKYLKKSHAPTLSIFNASPRSDGAAGVIVATPEALTEAGLKPEAYVRAFRMKGVDPNLMGLGQAEASLAMLEEAGKTMADIDRIEIHEAFAATAVAALQEIQNRTGYEWEKAFDEGRINPHGGSIATGHPFGATGVRLAINAIMDLEQFPESRTVMATACAHGGVAGAMLFERA